MGDIDKIKLHKELCCIGMEESIEALEAYFDKGTHTNHLRTEWMELEAVLDMISEVWDNKFKLTNMPSYVSEDAFSWSILSLHQALSKMSRFGPYDTNPKTKRKAWEQVNHYFCKAKKDLMQYIDLSDDYGDPSNHSLYLDKGIKVRKFLSYPFNGDFT